MTEEKQYKKASWDANFEAKYALRKYKDSNENLEPKPIKFYIELANTASGHEFTDPTIRKWCEKLGLEILKQKDIASADQLFLDFIEEQDSRLNSITARIDRLAQELTEYSTNCNKNIQEVERKLGVINTWCHKHKDEFHKKISTLKNGR